MTRWTLFAALLLGATTAQAGIVEETVRVPIAVTTPQGRVEQPVLVTIYRDTERGPAPFILYQHGRAGDPKRRAEMKQALPFAGPDLARRGFVVIAPTRIGYGATGGPDVERPGSCKDEDYPGMFNRAMQQGMALLKYAQALPFVDANRGLAMGVSFGGATSLATAQQRHPAIKGVVNLGGGMGGDPDKHPEKPCQVEKLHATLASYGRGTSAPGLWVYAPNDRFWGPAYPRQWYEAYQASGGKARFVQTQPLSGNGHTYLPDRAKWLGAFDHFTNEIGLR